MNWLEHVQNLKTGKPVSFRPKGNSMTPRIKSGQLVTVSPDLNIQAGDIVLCKVNGHFYVHLVNAIQGKRYQIANNHGHINGWTAQVFGKVINVED